jgi:hypothetical protein
LSSVLKDKSAGKFQWEPGVGNEKQTIFVSIHSRGRECFRG